MIHMRNTERQYVVISHGSEMDARHNRTQKTITARCPFCDAETKIYLWSLNGSGKMCTCGAKFESSGKAFKVVEVPSSEDHTSTAGFEHITLRLTRATCDALAMSEEGRHEDYTTALAEYETAAEPKGEKPEPCLAYTIASLALSSRASSKYVTIRVTSKDEARDLYYAVCSGTFQIEHLAAAKRIADALRERVRASDPALIRRWPTPNGD